MGPFLLYKIVVSSLLPATSPDTAAIHMPNLSLKREVFLKGIFDRSYSSFQKHRNSVITQVLPNMYFNSLSFHWNVENIFLSNWYFR